MTNKKIGNIDTAKKFLPVAAVAGFAVSAGLFAAAQIGRSPELLVGGRHEGPSLDEVLITKGIESTAGFEAERRREPWASNLEKQISRRYEDSKIASLGLAESSFERIECRSSACRLVLQYSEADQSAAERFGFADPYHMIRSALGPPGNIESPERVRLGATVLGTSMFVERREDGHLLTSNIVMFGRPNFDPSEYPALVERWKELSDRHGANRNLNTAQE